MQEAIAVFAEQLHRGGIALRIRDNRRKLFHLGRGRQGARELVLHPLLFDADPQACVAELAGLVLARDARHRPAVQARVDTAGLILAASPGLPDRYGPLFTPAERLGLVRLDALCRESSCELRLNDNGIQLLGLRHQSGHWRLDLHWRLVELPHCHDELLGFARRRGRGSWPTLDAALGEAFARIQGDRRRAIAADPVTAPPDLDDCERIGIGFDFRSCLDGLQRSFFPRLPAVELHWLRDPGPRRLRSIRFGTYHRRGGHGVVALHPRLRRPWVARIFVEHVLHHELCHHAQACQPQRGEKPHSARFRQWERGHPDHRQALAWERAHLDRLLGG